TDFTEDGSPTRSRAAAARNSASVGARLDEGGGADAGVVVVAPVDNDNADAVSRIEEDDALKGDEILFRLRLAHIYGRYIRESSDAVSISSLSPREGTKRKDHRKGGVTLTPGLFNGSIGRISAYFGSHVASYFVFLRFLVCLDLLMAIPMFGFVTLPQGRRNHAALRDAHIEDVLIRQGGSDSHRDPPVCQERLNKLVLPGDDDAPEGLSGDFGVLSTSVMFYGAYNDTKWGYYDRPLAYFLTWAAVNVVCFFLIGASMYIRYRTSKQAETSRDEFPFSTRVLSSWDHTLRKEEGAALWQKSIITNTKEMIREEKSHERSDPCNNLLFIRVLINLVVLGVLAGSGYLIFIVADNLDTSLGLPAQLEDLLLNYRLPLLVSALKVLVPPFFDKVIHWERWHPRTEIKLNISRTFCCWENEVGEEVFKLVLMDLGFILLATLLLDVLRAILIKLNMLSSLKYSEFAVASEVLDVIYGQSLVWLGLFFSPLLAAVGFVKLIVVFYFRYVTARMCKVPPRHVFRASRSGNFFMFMLLVNLLEPSTDCGPFKAEERVYNVITDRVGDLPTWLRDVVVYISTPAVVVPVVLILLLGILYFKAKTSSYQRVIARLRLQLKFERRVAKREVFARARFAQ
ncbi:hypothetical protein BaRGS_00022618, partial [Batillaria attramentaria]